jgi:myosin heavy subunit
MFKSEKVVFQAEGLGEFVQTVQFKDNEPIIDMLDSNNLSVFNLLDEWCSVASPDEQSFLTKIRFHHKKNEYFPATNLNTTSNSLFIRHTPREV